MELDSVLLQILGNQREDSERLARVETTMTEMSKDLSSVKHLQTTCPGRIAEMQRQARRAGLVATSKLLGWIIGTVTACAGAYTAVAAIFGG